MVRRIRVPDLLNQLALAENRGIALSGDPTTRGQLKLCRSWGFRIQARDGRLYLPFDSDTLVPAWIENETPRICWDPIVVAGFLETCSTNDEALRLAREGAAGGFVVYAERQTEGRGRMARRWVSPRGEGLYFSALVRPTQPVNRWPLLTLAAGAALAHAVNELSVMEGFPRSIKVELKWPNDLIVSGKKAAGILLETAGGRGPLAAAVVGVGINVGHGGIHEDLPEQATALSLEAGTSVPRRRLLVSFLCSFQKMLLLFEQGRHGEVLAQWKSYSTMWDGVPVLVVEGDRSRPAVTCGISDMGALKIRAGDGGEETLLAADVSVRPMSRGGMEK